MHQCMQSSRTVQTFLKFIQKTISSREWSSARTNFMASLQFKASFVSVIFCIAMALIELCLHCMMQKCVLSLTHVDVMCVLYKPYHHCAVWIICFLQEILQHCCNASTGKSKPNHWSITHKVVKSGKFQFLFKSPTGEVFTSRNKAWQHCGLVLPQEYRFQCLPKVASQRQIGDGAPAAPSSQVGVARTLDHKILPASPCDSILQQSCSKH